MEKVGGEAIYELRQAVNQCQGERGRKREMEGSRGYGYDRMIETFRNNGFLVKYFLWIMIGFVDVVVSWPFELFIIVSVVEE